MFHDHDMVAKYHVAKKQWVIYVSIYHKRSWDTVKQAFLKTNAVALVNKIKTKLYTIKQSNIYVIEYFNFIKIYWLALDYNQDLKIMCGENAIILKQFLKREGIWVSYRAQPCIQEYYKPIWNDRSPPLSLKGTVEESTNERQLRVLDKKNRGHRYIQKKNSSMDSYKKVKKETTYCSLSINRRSLNESNDSDS